MFTKSLGKGVESASACAAVVSDVTDSEVFSFSLRQQHIGHYGNIWDEVSIGGG